MENDDVQKKVKDNLQPFLDSCTTMLLDGLIQNKIIQEIKNPEENGDRRFELVREVAEKVSAEEPVQSDSKLVTDFLHFKEVVINVYFNLKYEHSDNVRKVPLRTLIEKFESMGVFMMPKPNKPRLKDILEKESWFFDDKEVETDAVKLFKEHNLNFNAYTNQVLEFYAREKVGHFFTEFIFDSNLSTANNGRRTQIDLIGKNASGADLLFEIKYRKKILSTLKETLFQGYEYLTRYDNDSKKSNYLILVTFTDEPPNTFDKANYRFQQFIEELFPGYAGKIFFVPVSTGYLHLIEEGFKKIEGQFNEFKLAEIIFSGNPQTITRKDDVTVNANFLSSNQGAFATWVKLKPAGSYFQRLMNFEYIISHATSNYAHNPKGYENVFSVSLAPDRTNNTKNPPTGLNWRVWIANENRESSYLNGPRLDNNGDQWYHIFVRWNHNLPKMEFYIDGKLVDQSSEYLAFWPKTILDRACIGTWGAKHEIHDLNLPLFRLITSSQFLDDVWLKTELKNRPGNER